jgi:signal transduction histidine kinase
MVVLEESTPQNFDEILAYVGFGDADSRTLQSSWEVVQPHVAEVTTRFYDTIELFPAARAVFADDGQVGRLKHSLARWLAELFQGPHDHAYLGRRLVIGRRHVQVGLPSRFMFTAMSGLRQHLRDLVRAGLPREQADNVVAALDKVLDVELAIMTGAYMSAQDRDRLAELRQVIVSNLPVCVLVLDDKNHVTTATHMSGAWFAGNPIGKNIDDVVVEPLRRLVDVPAAIAEARRTNAPVVFSRLDVELAKGTHSLRITVIPVQHSQAAAMVHVEDLSDVVAFENRAMNAESLASLGTMAASVAHEIRNPLAGISGVVQVVAASLEDGDDRKEALVRVQEQTGRLGGLVGELLTFARPITPTLAFVELRPVVEHAIALALATTKEAPLEGTDLRGLPAPGKPAAQPVPADESRPLRPAGKAARVEVKGQGRARIDPVLFAQVVQNLVQNAIQAGAHEVAVVLASGSVAVQDDGPGIAPEQRERVFLPFFTTKTRGTGLGLPMALKIVEAMRGRLQIKDSPLGGAAFVITLST